MLNAFLHWVDDYSGGIQIFVHNHAVLAPLLFLLAEETGVPLPVPGDVIIAYVGYGISKTPTVSVWEAMFIGLFAVLAGSTVLFHLSRRYGQVVIQWLGRFIFLKQSHIDKAEGLFKRYGIWAIIFGRHIPGMRIPITIFAATSGVRYRTFILSTFVSTVGWIFFYLKVGYRFGGDFQQLFQRDTGITVTVMIGLVVVFVGLHLFGRYREGHSGKDHEA